MYGVRHIPRVRFAVLALAAAATLLSAAAGGLGEAVAASRQAAMAIDANTGDVLYAQSADEPRHPASLTKMMTLYIAFGEIEAGRLTYDSRINISERAAAVAPPNSNWSPAPASRSSTR